MSSKKRVQDDSDSDSGPDDAPVVKKAKASSGPGKLNDEGDMCFLLGARKKVTVRSWKGNTYVDIREFYEKDGKELPGKKGVSLKAGDYGLLKDLIPHIDEALKNTSR